MKKPTTTTAARELLQTAARLGVKYLFTNLGSDHPAFIEAFASIDEEGGEMPEVVICPHEMTALSAAHGYAMVTRRPQMVLVHVDVGTQNLGCSVHNAARGRVPAIIVAGLSPVSTSGARAGARSEYIHYTQDTRRQHDIVDPYMKWSYELRAPEMVHAVLSRGLQIAATSPQGPVYITGAREVWEQPAASTDAVPGCTPAITAGLMPEALVDLHEAMLQSRRPVVITTYLGRDPQAVVRLASLSERLGFGVCEVNPQYVNFPGDHPHHLGYRRSTLVDEADLILMLDVDVPWIASRDRPTKDAKVFHVDVDPLKADLGLWDFAAHRMYNADSALMLGQWMALAGDAVAPGREARCAWIADARRRVALPPLPDAPGDGIDIQMLSEAIRQVVNDRTVVLFESPTATERLLSTLRMSRPGSYFANGGSGLGWGINAAIGAKLACPQAEVITLTGDGSYLFGVPSSAFWVARTYGAPQLAIVFNNRGWNAPRQSTLLVHPQGAAKRRDRYWISAGAGARYADIAAAAGGAVGFRASHRAELCDTLRKALEVVRGGTSAVVDVVMTPSSEQVL